MSIYSLEPRLLDKAAELPPQSPDFARRRDLLVQSTCRDPQNEAILICDPKDILYLTGVREGITWLALHGLNTFAVVRHLMLHDVREVASECEVILPPGNSTERADVEAFVVSELKRRGIRVAFVDTTKLPASTYLNLREHALAANLATRAAHRLTEVQRSIKDEPERQLIRRCVQIATDAFRQLTIGGADALVGRTERDVAAELERLMVDLGADRQGFPESGIIVASGPNSASAHHTPTRRRICRGEALLIDWGAELSCYRSDMTRTLFLGRPPAFATKAYPVVEKALALASALLAPGACMGDVDHIARDTILSAGMPEFHYGVGHGVGLDIHEGPWLRANSRDILSESMITTIEPGIYFPGTGGIRIENLYQIVPGGAETLGDLSVDFEAMILE